MLYFLLLLLVPFLQLPAQSEGQGLLMQALFLGNVSMNGSRDDCIWRRGNDHDECPDPDIKFYLYTSDNPFKAKKVDIGTSDWLRTHGWNPAHDNVVLVHGYGGGEGEIPMVVLRDAYIRNGSYNVFSVDWGPLSRIPCYPAAVHNLRSVAKCTADLFSFLRNSGVPVDRTTCVGHSLGAHVCGIVSDYLLFRMHRIIALDPARPLVRGVNKLRNVAAKIVQVIHTNAGRYGEAGHLGIIDFCINGGREQPFCENKPNVALCSHVRSVCYMAESINSMTARLATPCSSRRCPTGKRRPGRINIGVPLIMGQHTPDSAAGIFCLNNTDEPYCPSKTGALGDPRCCSQPEEAQNFSQDDEHQRNI